MTSYARNVGGPALRALTFHERAVMLKELGKHLMEHVAEFHELSLRTGATKGDGMGDIEGGIGTLFASGSVGTRQLPNDTVYARRRPDPAGQGRDLRRPARLHRAARRDGADQRVQLPGLGDAREARAGVPGRDADAS